MLDADFYSIRAKDVSLSICEGKFLEDTTIENDGENDIIVAKKQPSLKEIFDLGSKNTNGAYGYAFLNIFPSVYGWVQHKSKVRMEVQSKTYNASDEALALLLLENNYDMWNKPKGTQCDPKYTIRFQRDVPDDNASLTSKTKKDPGYGGWSYRGIKRFKELVDIVKKDRKTVQRKDMEIDFLEMMKLEREGQAVKKKVVETSLDEQMMNSEMMWKGLVADDDNESESDDDNESGDEGMTEEQTEHRRCQVVGV